MRPLSLRQRMQAQASDSHNAPDKG
jgi:hypothetical protein